MSYIVLQTHHTKHPRNNVGGSVIVPGLLIKVKVIPMDTAGILRRHGVKIGSLNQMALALQSLHHTRFNLNTHYLPVHLWFNHVYIGNSWMLAQNGISPTALK